MTVIDSPTPQLVPSSAPLVTEENQLQQSNRTCSDPSRTKPGRSVGCIEKYSLALAERLKSPRLLVDCRVSTALLRSTAEADIALLRETIESDNRLFADLVECITAIDSTVTDRDLEAERKALLSKVLQDLPEIDDQPMPNSKEEIEFQLRKAIFTVATRVQLVCERLAERGMIGQRRKLNETGTVQCFIDHQLRVHDEVLSSKAERETLSTDVNKRRYSTSTVTTDRVTQDCDIKTTETRVTVTRVLAGVEEHGIQAPVSRPERISKFVARCDSLLGKQFRLVTGGLCNYQESSQLLRQYEHHTQRNWTEQNESREIHYRQIGCDVATAAVAVGTVAAMFTIASGVAAAFAAKQTAVVATTAIAHIDPTICLGEFVLTGFLPDGFDLSAFEEDRA